VVINILFYYIQFIQYFLEKIESSKANEHENSTYKPSNIPEAKTNKTANIMKLLGKLIVSNNELFLCIEPLRK